MSSKWMQQIPPYKGDRPYLYFAFAEADAGRVWKYLRLLLARGVRIWYSYGPAGSAEELISRQERAGRAALTVVYLTDAICADKDTKSAVLVNQSAGRPLLCLDPDGKDRRLSMDLRENVPVVPLYGRQDSEEIERDILHADGFSQDMLGEPAVIREKDAVKRLSVLLCILALAIAAVSFAGARYLHWFRPAEQEVHDEVRFRDPVIEAAVRQAADARAAAEGGRAASGRGITKEDLSAVTVLRLDALPEHWDDLSLLPALEKIELPQDVLLGDGALPDGDLTISLRGGDGA